MKTVDLISLVGVALLLAACGSGAGDVADRVEDRAEQRADAIEENAAGTAQQRNVVEQQADQVRQAGEERAEAIRESDLDSDALTDAQKNALIQADGTTNKVRR